MGTVGTTWGPETIPGRTAPRTIAEVFGLSVTKGKHQMKFGGGYNRYTKNQVIGKDSEGDYRFDDKWNVLATRCPRGRTSPAIRIWTSCWA